MVSHRDFARDSARFPFHRVQKNACTWPHKVCQITRSRSQPIGNSKRAKIHLFGSSWFAAHSRRVPSPRLKTRRPWPAMIEMDRTTKAKIDAMWAKLGL
jgi:3-polyprenyl-4-hydroxybenzoate decarboxylase